jgi:hypothetical protein
MTPGCRWQGKGGKLRLGGWSRNRRTVILRRRPERSLAPVKRDDAGRRRAEDARGPLLVASALEKSKPQRFQPADFRHTAAGTGA